MMHKSGRNDILSPGASCSGKETPGASTKNDMYLQDYITRKQESDSFFDTPVPKKLTFDEWWDSGHVSKDNPYRQDSAAFWAYEGWKAAQENK